MKYYIILYLSMLLASGAQILLKLAASRQKHKPRLIQKYLDSLFILGLLAMTVSMLMNVKGLRHVPLKDMAFILPTIYIATPILSWVLLGEKYSKTTIIGIIIMLIGIAVFNIPM